MLLKRIISSIVLIGIIWLVIFSRVLCGLTVVLFIIAGLYEYFTMLEKKGISIYKYFGIGMGVIIPLSIMFKFEPTKNWELLFIVLALLSLILMQFKRRNNAGVIVDISTTLFGILYVSWFFSFVIKLRFMDGGLGILAALLLITKLGDIGAYIVGRSFGRHLLIPRISPNKTVEGALGSFIFSLIGALISKPLLGFGYLHLILIGAGLSILGQLGDLSESLLKRDCQVKDSGNLIPGMGGILDEIDSVLFTAPVFYFYLSSIVKMKNIAILGSTGSIGRSALSVVRSQAKHFRAACLSVNSDIDNLYKQIKEFRPFSVCVRDKKVSCYPGEKIKPSIKIYCGESGLEELVKDKRIDQVMFALSGAAALRPLVSAIKSGKDIALANKEAMVMAGPIIMRLAARHKVKILPVDSEQSAIWQALSGSSSTSISSIYLTASGGPFRSVPKNKLRSVTINDVLAHPRWRMGRKITVDSATLMNKGLELLEAMFLFNVEAEKIKVLIHPEAIIHSMVEFADGVVIAQLSEPDMRIPIQYALSYPARLPGSLPKINFYGLKNLNFGKPDFDKFPSLGLAYQAARDLGSMPAVLNAANEESVESFLNKRISFLDIPRVVARVMARHRRVSSPDLRQVMQTDSWAREEARSIISSLKS